MAGEEEEAPPAWLAALLTAQRHQTAQMITAAQGAAEGAAAGRISWMAQTTAAASVVGSTPPCALGKDKVKRFKKWSDWLRDVENKMRFLNLTEGAVKLNFIRSIAGPELTEYWEKEARIRFTAEEVAGVLVPAHTYDQVVGETKTALLKMVSRDKAIIDLLRLEQGSRSFMEFLSEVEDQTYLCQTWERLSEEDMKRISILAGLRDRTLAEKALAEDYTLKQVIQAAVNRESAKANAEGLRARPANTVKKVEEEQGGTREARINHLQAELEELELEQEVWKVRQSGKYSSRFKGDEKEEKAEECARCTYTKHRDGDRCPAERRTCNECGLEGHFANSRTCKKKKKRMARARRVKEESTSCSSEESEEEELEDVRRVVRWPGSRPGARRRSVRHITGGPRREEEARGGSRSSRRLDLAIHSPSITGASARCDKRSDVPTRGTPDFPILQDERQLATAEGAEQLEAAEGPEQLGAAEGAEYVRQVATGAGKRRSRWVTVTIGGTKVKLYTDTGSRLTIIPPETYRPSMGKVVAAKSLLRAWGSDKYLDTKGMFRTSLVTTSGARKDTWVYVVAGARPEPLLGDHDAEDLGIITFHPEGRRQEEQDVRNISIPAKLRQAGKVVLTERPPLRQITTQGKAEATRIVSKYMGPVFTDRIGRMKVQPVELRYQPGFRPVQPARYAVPFHYRDRLATHLRKLKDEDVIEDVNPSEPIDCVLNLAISEKKAKGSIRMNIDARPINKGAIHPRYHVTLPQEVRHQLEGAKVFSEFDMGNGFMQVPLAPSSQVVFQSHLGLHRIKRLFFGPTNSSGIFHHEVSKAFAGLKGCITIHDNLLVYGRTEEEHNKNLAAMLQRAQDRGVTLKLSKSTVCEAEVKWFGRVYSAAGVSADPDKIDYITRAGRPESMEEVRSLLQAAGYNARYSFDHKETKSYEEVTAPLRQLLEKDADFVWDKARETSFQELIRMMNSRTYLAPYNPKRKTHLVTDASPRGIAASLYQEDEEGRWVPVDHASRAMSAQEQGWDSQIDWESLAKVWGMEMFRPYLIGMKFSTWGDHRPLIPLYNDLSKAAPVRVTRHRKRILDLKFTDHYLPGKRMPCDYASRHPKPIDHMSPEEKETLMVDEGEEREVMRVIKADLPPALSLDLVREVARRLREAVQSGRKPRDGELTPYMSVWTELGVVQELVCRGEKLIIPAGRHPRYDVDLRDWVVDLAHGSHQGVDGTKRLLRMRLWFPGMDKAVERAVATCLPCQASVESHTRDPLKPSKAPEEPWFRLYADHWGPTQDGHHILVIIDGLTRYPEVMVVRGTSAEDNIHAFSEVFSRHGIPAHLHSDNGAPFNGKDSHLLQRYLASLGVEHHPNRSAEDPEATGLVEAFMKHLKKVFHTAGVAREDPFLKINDYLMHYRATPHPTTKKSPAELLFNRKFVTRLPDLRTNPARGRADIKEAREEDKKAKEKMKEYKDKGNVKEHTIAEGDKVLLKRKSTKHDSVYDPQPYTVTSTHGTQIRAEREGQEKTRDAQRWKKVEVRPRRSYKEVLVEQSRYQVDPDIGAGTGQVPARRPAAEQAGAAQGGGGGAGAAEGRGGGAGAAEGRGGGAGAAEGRGGGAEAAEGPALAAAGAALGLAPADLEARPDIQARLRGRPEVILAPTPTNRAQRTRQAPQLYQADVRLRDRKGVKGGRKGSARRDT